MIWQSIIGLAGFVALAWGLGGLWHGGVKRAFPLRIVLAGLALQAAIALVLLNFPPAKALFLAANRAVLALHEATLDGTKVVFGYIGGGALPFTESFPGASFILAFQALPLVLVISALSALLFYWRVLPAVVRGFAWALNRTLGLSGAAGVATAANVFVGMVEAPLLIRPYLKRLAPADLFLVMTAGMATIAGTVLVLYATILKDVLPDPAGHLLTASLMNAAAAVIVARLMMPAPEGAADMAAPLDPSPDHGAMEAITRGTGEGVQLLINITAMIIVLVALVSLVNLALGLIPDVGAAPLTLQRLLGWVMAPVVWLMGVPWAEAPQAGSLMGIKTVLNEFLAYLEMAKMGPEVLSDRTRMIMAYAMSGFANFGSLGIMIGGLVAMAPERRGEIVRLAPMTMVSGTLATCLTGTMAGILG
ncbi:MAG TPA: nucleoside:proton symporter [Rhodospirillaceae bacterium]|nr:nucleoside:proton symporter [Rhodospirillaceae bacterium]